MSKRRLVSSARVISRVMTIMKLSGSDWIADGYEYIGDALQMIGTSAPLIKKGKELTIENFRHELPCDLETLYFVEYEGRMLRNGGDYTGYDLPRNERTTKIYTGVETTGKDTDLIYLDGDPAIFESKHMLSDEKDYYLLNPDYIQTSFEGGCIKLHYAGFPLDKHGCPYIVDDANYQTAIVWYVIYQMLLSGYGHPKLKWTDAEERWFMYLPRAQNAMKIPDMGEMERFRKMWTRMKPPTMLPEDFFAGSEATEYWAGI